MVDIHRFQMKEDFVCLDIEHGSEFSILLCFVYNVLQIYFNMVIGNAIIHARSVLS